MCKKDLTYVKFNDVTILAYYLGQVVAIMNKAYLNGDYRYEVRFCQESQVFHAKSLVDGKITVAKYLPCSGAIGANKYV